MYKQLRKLPAYSLLCIATCHLPAVALNEDRLWLPIKYQRYFLDLRDAALAAEALDRCKNVIRGTIDLQKSTEQAPIFRIQCRQENGRTYNELVDGISKKTLTTVILSPEAKLAEQQAIVEAQKQAFFEQCKALLIEKTALFEKVTLLDEQPAPKHFSEDKAQFEFQFDSVDMHGSALKYRVKCDAEKDKSPKMTLRKRHD